MSEPIPAGVELDTLVSDLLGVDRATWQPVCVEDRHNMDGDGIGQGAWCYTCSEITSHTTKVPKRYSTTWAAAGEVLEACSGLIVTYPVEDYDRGRKAFFISHLPWKATTMHDGQQGVGYAKTGPHAICLAFVAYKQAQKASTKSYPQ